MEKPLCRLTFSSEISISLSSYAVQFKGNENNLFIAIKVKLPNLRMWSLIKMLILEENST